MMHAIYNRALRTTVSTMFCFILLALLLVSGLPVASSSGNSRTAVAPVSGNGSSAESLRKSVDQMMGQMAALKREITRDGETPELMSRYDALANRIHEAARQSQNDYTSAAVQPLAPTVSICTANSLAATDNTFQRPNPGSSPTSCPAAFTIPTCPGGAAPIVRFDNFGFNLTGCTFPTCVTISMCGAAPCAGDTAQNMDSLIYVYRTGGATAGTGAVIPFNKGQPCVNLVGGNDDGTFPSCAGGANDALRSSLTISLGPGHFVVVVCAFSATLQNTGNYHLLVDAPAAGCVLTAEPTAVDLDAFTATGYDDGTLLEWRTGLEVDNLGFNIYRDAGGKRIRINKQMIAGSALTTGPGVNLKTGRAYWSADYLANNKGDAQYWLEDVGLDGQSRWHGPFTVDQSKPRAGLPPPAKGKIVTLSDLGSVDAQPGATVPLGRTAKPPEITAAQLQSQSDLAMRPAAKLAVNREGWYRVTQPELVAAGIDPKTHPRMLQLFVDGKEQPCIINGEADGRFDAVDSIEFYGLGLASAVTDTRTYWVVAGSQPGRRIDQVKGKGSKDASASFPYTVERKERTIYFPALRNGDQENFFGAVIARDPVDQALTLLHVDRAAAADATLEVALQGVTEQAHRVRIDVNGSVAGELNFNGQQAGWTRVSLPAAALKEGQNTVRLTALGGDQDVSLVSSTRLTYAHTYTADNDALRFTLAKKQKVTIDGFSNPAIRVIDISDPDAVQEVSSSVQRRGNTYAVTVAAPGSGKSMLLAFADGQVKRPVAVTFNQPSNLRVPAAGADFVIVSHRDFIDSLQPLVALRQSEGLSVMVVDVEDVYDEFSYGAKSPQAIKDFLSFATSSWQKSPHFAMLVGDASYDPKNYLGFGDSDFVPTRMIDTQLMKTASDAWLADFNGDGAEDIALGRLPVRTADEAARMVARIINYNQSRPVDDILLVSDTNDGYDFQNSVAQLRALIPANVKVQQVERGAMDDATARTTIIDALNRGQKIVNYSGHGNVNQWRGNILTNDDAGQLLNDHNLSLFITMTCLNGYFQDPAMDSLAESLMQARNGGAIAVWGSSGMTSPHNQERVNQQLYRLLFSPGLGATRLGDAIAKAKAAETDRDVRMTWILFGDPTLRLK